LRIVIKFFINQLISSVVSWLVSNISYFFSTSTGDESHFPVTSTSSSFLNSNNYVVGKFSSVNEYISGMNKGVLYDGGHIEYEFKSVLDKPLIFPELTFPYNNKQRKLDFLYGMPKSTKFFDNNNNLVNEKTFTYAELLNTNNDENYLSFKVGPTKFLSSPDDPANGELFTNNSGLVTPYLVFDSYPFYSGKNLLGTTSEKQYKGNDFVETYNLFSYVPNSHLLRGKAALTLLSGNKNSLTVFRYPFDYTTATETLMTEKNIIAPISTENYSFTTIVEPAKLVSKNVSEFAVVGNGDIKPVKSYNLEVNEPILFPTILNAYNAFNPNQIISDPNIIKQNTEITYDLKGNVSEQIAKPSNRVSSTMYDVDNMPIASISNTNRADVAYSSFELRDVYNSGILAYQGDTPPPGWQWDDPKIFYVNETSPTGTRHVNLQWEDDEVKTNIPITKESVLSFWATGNFKINGFYKSNLNFRVTSAPINGWTYYEYLLPAGSPQQIITGTTKLDEVRIYPSNAKMVTSNYDLASNKINECDINNRIVYYEYDKLGRPLTVMDEKRNVIKTYEYHFKN
jgi:hypothetical protein